MIKGWIVFSSTASVKTFILHLLGKLLLKSSSKKEKELKIPPCIQMNTCISLLSLLRVSNI